MFITEELMLQENVGKDCSVFLTLSNKTSIFPWVKPPVPAGKKIRGFCPAMNQDVPITLPEDKDLYIVGYWVSANQRTRIEWFWNDQLAFTMFTEKNGWQFEYGSLKQSTKDIAPLLPPPYTIDLTIKNLGKKSLKGTFVAYGILLEKEE